MIHYKHFFIVIFSLFQLVIFGQHNSMFDYDHSRAYADYLFKNKYYHLAASEYDRVVFLNPADTVSKKKLLLSYKINGEYKKALGKAATLFHSDFTGLPEGIATEVVELCLLSKDYLMAGYLIENSRFLNKKSKNNLRLGTIMLQSNWQEANQFFTNNAPNDLSADWAKLGQVLNQARALKYKKPWQAAAMSAIVPGTGKFYTGDWKDAIYSFVIVAGTSYLAYNSIENRGVDINAILYGSLGFSFYVANIYGSFKSAKKRNRKMDHQIHQQVEGVLIHYTE